MAMSWLLRKNDEFYDGRPRGEWSPCAASWCHVHSFTRSPLMSAPRMLMGTLVEAPLGGDVLLLDGVRTIRVEDPVRRR